MNLGMKTKLDKNGLTVYTIESKQDCIDALETIKQNSLKNQYMHNHIPEIENTIQAVKDDSHNIVLNIKRMTNFKPLYNILYIFKQDYLHKLWDEQNAKAE